MEISSKKNEDNLIVKISGRLDTLTASEFGEQILQLSKSEKNVTIDCSDLSYISSAGLRIFISLHRQVVENNRGEIRIENMNSVVKDIFDVMNFTSLFKF